MSNESVSNTSSPLGNGVPTEWAELSSAYQLDAYSKMIDVDPSLFLPANELPAHYERSWKLYSDMGSPKTVCAPMVNQSELPFRMFCRKYKTELCYTPMINSLVFLRNPKSMTKHFSTAPEDRPLIAQLCGDEPEIILSAAVKLQGHVDAIDLNLGCPQGIAKKGHYGSYLLPETRLVQKIVRTLHDGLKVPVTVKIRILQDDPTGFKTLALGRALQNTGASIVTLHGRTRDNTKDNIGGCNFEMIRRLKAELLIPVFANGGVENIHDVREAAYVTKADAVMVSEALLTWPTMLAFDKPQDMPDPVDVGLEFVEINKIYPGREGCIRPHLFKLLFRELAIHTGVRYLLGAPKIAGDLASVMHAIRQEQHAMYDLHLSDPTVYSAKTFIKYADTFAEGKKHMVTERDLKKTQNASTSEDCCEETKENTIESLPETTKSTTETPLDQAVFDAISQVLSSPETYTLPVYASKKARAAATPYEFKNTTSTSSDGQETGSAASETTTAEVSNSTGSSPASRPISEEQRTFLEEIYSSKTHWYHRYFAHNTKNCGSKLAAMLAEEARKAQSAAITDGTTTTTIEPDAKRAKLSEIQEA